MPDLPSQPEMYHLDLQVVPWKTLEKVCAAASAVCKYVWIAELVKGQLGGLLHEARKVSFPNQLVGIAVGRSLAGGFEHHVGCVGVGREEDVGGRQEDDCVGLPHG